jgi:hypothetical protein
MNDYPKNYEESYKKTFEKTKVFLNLPRKNILKYQPKNLQI